MAKLYDLVLMLDPNVPDDRHQEILSAVRTSIEGNGTIALTQDWGMRRMAYEIDHRPDAAYHLLQFETESGELLEKLSGTLRITDGVLRHRIVKVKPGTPPPPTPRTEAPRPAREPDQPEGTVAARAAADAPAPAEEPAAAPEPAAEAPAEVPVEAPAEPAE